MKFLLQKKTALLLLLRKLQKRTEFLWEFPAVLHFGESCRLLPVRNTKEKTLLLYYLIQDFAI